MQRPVTPKPGQTAPDANVINRDDYKLGWYLREYRAGEYQLNVHRYIPETGWATMSLYLTQEELDRIRNIVNGTGN